MPRRTVLPTSQRVCHKNYSVRNCKTVKPGTLTILSVEGSTPHTRPLPECEGVAWSLHCRLPTETTSPLPPPPCHPTPLSPSPATPHSHSPHPMIGAHTMTIFFSVSTAMNGHVLAICRSKDATPTLSDTSKMGRSFGASTSYDSTPDFFDVKPHF